VTPRLNLTDEQRRERKRVQDKAAYDRYRAHHGLRDRSRSGFILVVSDPPVPAEVIAERDRVLTDDRRDPAAILMGDPPPGRRAIDRKGK
jgi:hypothetical protein